MKRIPPRVADIVATRAAGNCEAMNFPSCNGRAEHLHHRQLRSQGGGHDVVNLIHVCHLCHEWIHKNPKKAYELGWLVRSVHEPSVTPVAYRGRLFLLDKEGGVQPWDG